MTNVKYWWSDKRSCHRAPSIQPRCSTLINMKFVGLPVFLVLSSPILALYESKSIIMQQQKTPNVVLRFISLCSVSGQLWSIRDWPAMCCDNFFRAIRAKVLLT